MQPLPNRITQAFKKTGNTFLWALAVIVLVLFVAAVTAGVR